MRPRLIVAGVLVALLVAAAIGWTLLRAPAPERWIGYVEGEALYIAAPLSGTLAARGVERGDRVAAGDALFTLDPVITDAETARLQGQADAARAQLANLEKRRQRPAELQISRARLAAARAEAVRTQKDYERIAVLSAKGFATRTSLDAARAARDVARADIAQAQAEEASGELTAGRADEVQAAAANVASAEASLRAQGRRRSEISPVSPATGSIEQTFYNPGEWVPANAPILSVLPDNRRKIRFFVPETMIAKIRVGAAIRFTCDGCAGVRSATIRYIAPRAEFTPPVIYSEGARAKLVFLVEAALAPSTAPLPLGLPVDITPVAAP